ncbi:hypothetical protein EI42_03267 [Thermosporothrix hazakensis]|jgi:ferric iron reductase protein FhuF|uniref:Uncharacterized protein n=1 Tax=Thermosporothrix hazakensis TaxID=644383 RepID=A0A326U5F1_THEHA|nr:hypothetical protein [Thermosporothrix hazakensis]PZW28513.1 hypothetical protein EI42_03267 [Thermosporothrix hazakensis]GCE45287.1 hypothetical protein KTH_01560 [Thermosporothrix hazakensis]
MLRVRLTRDQLAAIVYSCELNLAALKSPVKTREQERREQLLDDFLAQVWEVIESSTDTQEMPGQPLP